MAHRIAKIETRGLRAHDREIDLGPLTLLRGPVGSGKTTIADAVRIAALGCVPSIGKDSTAVARIMRDGAMMVRLTLDDGRTCGRGYLRRGERLQGEADASWMPPRAKLTETCESIRALVGRDDREAAEHLDLKQLLSCSPNERAKRIEEMLDASGMSAAEQIAWMNAYSVLRLAGVDFARIPGEIGPAEAAASGALALLTPAVRAAMPDVLVDIGREVKAGGVPRAIEVARERKALAAEDIRRRVAARAEMEDRVRALRAPADALDSLRKRRDAEAAAKAGAERDLEMAERIAAVRAELDPLIPALRRRIAEEEERLAAAVARIPEADAARTEADGLTEPPPVDAPAVVEPDAEQFAAAEALIEEAKALPEPESVGIPEAEEIRIACLRADAERLWKESDAIEIPEPLSSQTAEAAAELAEKALARAKTSPWREVEHVADGLEEWGATLPGILPRKDVPLDAAKRLRELASQHGGDLEDAELYATEACRAAEQARKDVGVRTKQIRDAKEEIDRLRKSAEEADQLATKVTEDARTAAEAATREARSAWQKRVAELRSRADQLRRDAQGAAKALNDACRGSYARAVGEREVLVAEIADRRKALFARAEGIRSAAIEAQTALDKARADLRAAEERLEGIGSIPIDVEHARGRVESATAAIAELDGQVKELQSADSLRAEMKALIDLIDQATALRDAWTAVEWALQRVREKDLAARAGGLEARMRRYLRAAGRTEDPYLRAARGTCDFGLRRGRKEISVEALSGGEAALFGACLAGAVVSLRNPEIRILLLEAAELGDRPEARQTLLACREMVTSGDIDQVIAATCIDIEAPEGWETVDLEPPEVEAVTA